MMGALVLPSCDFMYDDPDEEEVIKTDGTSFAYVNSSSYAHWVYINLASHDTLTVAYDDETGVPSEWDFALHRYNCKTNGGACMETSFSTIDALTTAIADGTFTADDCTFTADTDSVISVDMSQMMQGIIGYADSPVNKVLSHWMTLDTSVMPPTYTTSDKVYILRRADGTYAAIRFTDYSNAKGATGYISFDYVSLLSL